jgi:Kef-type K+ transport system membrane component KefB
MADGDTLRNAVLGAAVTVVFSFTGFSPLLGGAVAGYLQRRDRREGARVGAISGALATIPFLLLVAVFFGAFGLLLRGGGLLWMLVVLPLFLVLVAAWNVGLGAAGGYLGVYVQEELQDERTAVTR